MVAASNILRPEPFVANFFREAVASSNKMLCPPLFDRKPFPHSLEECIWHLSDRILPDCIAHFCFATFCQPAVGTVPTEVDRVRPATIFHQNGCNITKRGGLFVALVVAYVLDPEGLVLPSRVANRTRNESNLLQTLVVNYLHVVARHVILRLWHSVPLFLQGSLAAHGALVLQRALTVHVNPRPVGRTRPLLWIFGLQMPPSK